jgi:hypothetical protein
MIRRLFTILSVLSLLLCVATVVLWVRSYWTADGLEFEMLDIADGRFHLTTAYGDSGGFVVRTTTIELPQSALEAELAHARDSGDPLEEGLKLIARRPEGFNYGNGDSFWNRRGFTAVHETGFVPHAEAGTYTLRTAQAPCWAAAALTAALPMAFIFRRWNEFRRRSQQSSGHCPACSYDLRASPDRCPECGTVPVTKGIA